MLGKIIGWVIYVIWSAVAASLISHGHYLSGDGVLIIAFFGTPYAYKKELYQFIKTFDDNDKPSYAFIAIITSLLAFVFLSISF